MGTAAAEGKAGGDGPRDELGFRRRGDRTTRLEAFVDAAFAFALSLMVIAVGSVPRSPEELSVALKGVPAFAACFWLIAKSGAAMSTGVSASVWTTRAAGSGAFC